MVILGNRQLPSDDRRVLWRVLVNLRESMNYYKKERDLTDPLVRKGYDSDKKIYRKLYNEYFS